MPDPTIRDLCAGLTAEARAQIAATYADTAPGTAAVRAETIGRWLYAEARLRADVDHAANLRRPDPAVEARILAARDAAPADGFWTAQAVTR